MCVEFGQTRIRGFPLSLSLQKYPSELQEVHFIFSSITGSLVGSVFQWYHTLCCSFVEWAAVQREEQTQGNLPLQTTPSTYICIQFAARGSPVHVNQYQRSLSQAQCAVDKIRGLHSETDFIWWHRCLYPVSSTIWNQCSGRWIISMYRRCTFMNWNMRCFYNVTK